MDQPDPLKANLAVESVENAESSSISEKLSLKQKVTLFMLTSPIGIAIEVLTMILSLVSCGMYIGQTYYDDAAKTDEMVLMLRDFDIADFSLTLYFLAVYLLDAYTAEELWQWAMSPLALADFVTVFPPLIFFIPELFFSSSSVVFFGSLNFLRFIRILKILRIARLAKHLAKGDNDDVEVQKQLFSVTFMVFSIVFVFAGIFHLVENTFNAPSLMSEKWGMDHLEFHDALYFTIVTVATVGFGDIYPLSIAGKFLVIILIATTIVVISNEVNTLFAMLALKSVYARNSYAPPKGSPPHIILCGFVDYTNLSSFLEEFYCEDHGEVEESVVVLCSDLPSVSVEFLLRMPRYRDRLSYLQGSALNERDLKRASCSTASTVFILADQFSSDPFSHDSANILLCVSIRSYSVANNLNDQSCIHTILQLIRPESQYHFKNCQSSLYGNYQLLIIDQIRMGIFSKCCHCPGFSTLISNLVMSMSIESNPNMKEWLREYTAGAGWELYRVAMSPFFAGTSFSSAANIIFSEIGVIVFAIDINKAGVPVAVPFPANFTIPIGCMSHVYVLAEDNESALGVSTYNASEVELTARLADASSNSVFSRDQNTQGNNSPATLSSKIMAQKYFLRKESAVKQSVFFVNSAASLKDVILVCGIDAGLFDFVKPLRRKTSTSPSPIVIMSLTRPKDWRSLASFQNVFFVTGSPLEPVDLVRAGVMNARNAVILCSSGSQSSSTEHLMDAEAIFTFQGIVKINPSCKCVVELVSSHSVSYLQSGHVENERLPFSVGVDGSLLSPVYACGTAFVPVVLHRLTCQAYYNKSLLKMLSSFFNIDEDETGTDNRTDAYLVLDELTFPADSLDHAASILPSELQLNTIPAHFYGSNFGAFFRWSVLQNESLPIGIYRAPNVILSAKLPYVVACPAKDMTLYEGDRVFELKAPSSQVKMFQDLDLSLESGRSHVPSQAGLASTSIASSSISLRKQLLLVMRQLSEDIESVRQDIGLRKSASMSPTRLPAMDGHLSPSLPGQTQFGKELSGSRLSPLHRGSS